MDVFSFVLWILVIVCFLLHLGLMKKSEKKTPDSLKMANSFPFEFYQEVPLPKRISFFVPMALAVLFLMISSIRFSMGLGCLYFYLAFGAIALSSLLLLGTHLISFRFYRTHVLLSLFSFVLFGFGSILIGISAFLLSSLTLYPELCHPVLFVLIGSQGVVTLFSLFNPRLFSWAKMEKSEVDGKTVYTRPKINFLSLYEWLMEIQLSLYCLFLGLDVLLSGI